MVGPAVTDATLAYCAVQASLAPPRKAPGQG